MQDDARALLARLRDDLRSAMRERQSKETSVLRGLIAAIDNAQAVPVGDLHASYAVHEFGDKSVEVPRRPLSGAELRALLAREVEERNRCADEYRRLDRPGRADELLQEAAIIACYLAAD